MIQRLKHADLAPLIAALEAAREMRSFLKGVNPQVTPQWALNAINAFDAAIAKIDQKETT